MQFNSVINVLYVPYVTVYNKMNFSHDKNKPFFDQVKYDEQKSSDDNFCFLFFLIHLMLLTCLNISCIMICYEDRFAISLSFFAELNLAK